MTQTLIQVESIFDHIGGFDHRCRLPPSLWPNDTFIIQGETHRRLVEKFIPRDDSCQIYNKWNETVDLISCPFGSVFSQNQYNETYIAKTDLVCDNQIWVVLLTQSLLLGNMFGSVLGGWLSDRKGRKPCIQIGIVLQVFGGLLSGLKKDKFVRMFAKFSIGMSIALTFSTGFVLSLELVSKKYRLHVSTIIAYVYAVGGIILTGLAFLIPGWQGLQIAITVPSILFFAYFWLIPESPRWLFSVGRVEEAYNILETMGKWNKRPLEPRHYPTWWTNQLSSTTSMDSQQHQEERQEICSGILKSNVLQTLIICYQWLAVSLIYYAILFYTSYINDENVYIASFLLCVAEIIGYLAIHVTVNRVGRVKPYVILLFISAITSLLTGSLLFRPDDSFDWTILSLFCIIKLSSSGALALLYMWTAELFPTTLRSAGVGITSMIGQGGMVLAALLVQVLPMIIRHRFLLVLMFLLGIFVLPAGTLAFKLPETLDRPLPQTTNEEEESNQFLVAQDAQDRGELRPLLTDDTSVYNL